MTAVIPRTRFDAAFASREPGGLPGLIPYFTAGFPRLDDTPALLCAAERAGCVAIEVGIPFSDPLADGPTIQRAGVQALRNGMTVHLAVEQIAEARRLGLTIPLAPMSYINPILAYGVEAFVRDVRAAGADGLIIVDLPAEEAAGIRAIAHGADLALIPLVAPTTPRQRLERVLAGAAGFVYCVSVTGVTGARDDIAPEALRLLEDVRSITPVPRALGFGLHRHEHLVRLRGHAEAAAVGSALISAIAAEPDDPVEAASRFLHGMLDG